jgi:hypothetical protein
MKKIIIAFSMLLLSGCSLLDAYLMTHYDSNEYQLITDIRAEAQLAKTECDDAIVSRANAYKLAYNTKRFVLYSEHVPRNTDVINASKDLHVLAQGLVDQYAKSDKVSPGFCKIKFTNVETSANKMQQVIGRRPR